MNSQTLRGLAAGIVAAVLALGQAAAAHPPEAAAVPSSANLQGDDQQSWINDPHMHAFYDATVAAFARGPVQVDVAAFERHSFTIFREFGASRGMRPEAMQDHLKLIPRQVVQIVQEDPKVLDSYANFVAAVFGPQ